jgi:hypothetical protein
MRTIQLETYSDKADQTGCLALWRAVTRKAWRCRGVVLAFLSQACVAIPGAGRGRRMNSIRDAMKPRDMSATQCPNSITAAKAYRDAAKLRPEAPQSLRDLIEGRRIYTVYEAPERHRFLKWRKACAIDWVSLFAWLVVAVIGMTTAFVLGWFCRDHLAPWLRLGIHDLIDWCRACWRAWAG